MSRWDLGRGWTGVVLAVVKELGFPNVRSVVALPSAQTVPSNEHQHQHPLPKSNPMSTQSIPNSQQRIERRRSASTYIEWDYYR